MDAIDRAKVCGTFVGLAIKIIILIAIMEFMRNAPRAIDCDTCGAHVVEWHSVVSDSGNGIIHVCGECYKAYQK